MVEAGRLQAQMGAVMTIDATDLFFHGGPRGLRGWILPACETRAPNCSSYGASGIHRRDRVYVTTDPTAALLFACGQPDGGAVYVVEPEGSIEPDPDWQGDPGVSVQCERARIVSVRKVRGKLMKRVQRQILGAR